MAIVKMKRLQLIALAKDRDALLSELLHGGCVEVREPEEEALAGDENAALLHREDMKKCVLCGGWYIPKSNRAKYCPDCSKQEQRRKTRERVRRHRAAM